MWVPAGGRALPGDRIAVDTAETGEHQTPRAGRISSKSGVSGSVDVCLGCNERAWSAGRRGMVKDS